MDTELLVVENCNRHEEGTEHAEESDERKQSLDPHFIPVVILHVLASL
jgi:hypothetical protein